MRTFRSACSLKSVEMWKHTWMTLWSSHIKVLTYWLTLLKPLPTSEGMISSLIHQSAHSEFLAENYSVSISERGIDANPEKVGAILRMKRPVRVHDVQKLTGCLAALIRFISRLGEKALCHDQFSNKIFIEKPIPFTDQ